MPIHTVTTKVAIPYDALAEFCQKHYLRRMWFFGSVLRDDFHSNSDIDILVEFDPDHIPGWEFYSTWVDELEEIMGYPIDLGTPDSLSPHIHERVMQSAQVVYERAVEQYNGNASSSGT